MPGWILVAGVVLVVGLVAWPTIKARFGGSIPAGVTTALDKTTDYADEAVASGSLGIAALMFKKHGDTEAVAQIGVLWGKAMAWDDKPTAMATPTVEALAASVAGLQAQLASQTVSSIPDAALAMR